MPQLRGLSHSREAAVRLMASPSTIASATAIFSDLNSSRMGTWDAQSAAVHILGDAQHLRVRQSKENRKARTSRPCKAPQPSWSAGRRAYPARGHRSESVEGAPAGNVRRPRKAQGGPFQRAPTRARTRRQDQTAVTSRQAPSLNDRSWDFADIGLIDSHAIVQIRRMA